MSRRFLLFILLLPMFLMASVQWQENGVPVRQGDHLKHLKSNQLSDGSIVHLWTDCRDGNMGIYGQRMNSEGEKQWDELGKELFQSHSVSSIYDVIPASDGNFFAVWTEKWYSSNPIDYIHLQKFDQEGNQLWEADRIIHDNTDYHYPSIISDEEGGVYLVLFSHGLSGTFIHHYLADGTTAENWNEPVLLDTHAGALEVCSDKAGGLYLATLIEDDIYINRIDSAANKLWGNSGILATDTSINFNITKMEILAKSAEEYIVSWVGYEPNSDFIFEMNSYNNLGENIWENPAQFYCDILMNYNIVEMGDSSLLVTLRTHQNLVMNKIDQSGNVLWGDTGNSVIENVSLYTNQDCVTADYDGNCTLIWTEQNSGTFLSYMQKIGLDGNFLFEENIQLNESISYIPAFKLFSSQTAYYISWSTINDCFQMLKHQILDYSGNMQLAELGESFHQGIYGESRNHIMVDNGNNPVLLWEDNRNLINKQIYIQILDEDGSPMLAEDGIPITTSVEMNQHDVAAVIGKNSGDIITTWVNNQDEYDSIGAQALDTSGNYLWSNAGLEVSNPNEYSSNPNISCYDNNGIDEYYLGWQSFSSSWNFDILAQKYVDGNPQWDEPITIADSDNDCNLIAVKDRFFVWLDGIWGAPNINVMLLAEDGNPAPGWSDGYTIQNPEIHDMDGLEVKLVTEGLLLTWIVNLNNGVYKIVGQIIDFEGNTVCDWNNMPFTSGSYIDDFSTLVIGENIYLIWMKYEDGVRKNLLQKYNMLGEAIWEENLHIYSDENYVSRPAVLSAINIDVLAVWSRNTDDLASEIKAQLISPNGDLSYDSDGLTVAANYSNMDEQLVYSNGNKAFISWLDGRSPYISEGLSYHQNIYAQKLLLEPTNSPNDIVEPETWQLSNYPNPFNPTTNILYSLDEDANVELSIYNIKGQKIKTLVKDMHKLGEHSAIWNGFDDDNNPVSSGIYLYKLKTDRKETTKRMLLLK